MSTRHKELTQAYLKDCLDYDPETGIFTWKERPREHFKDRGYWQWWNSRHAHTRAGSVGAGGYRVVFLRGHLRPEHRVAWCFMTGVFPAGLLDHKNRDRADNRFANLREATPSQNATNARTPRHNTSGFRGVSRDGKSGRWRAEIKHRDIRRYLGSFSTLEEAAIAYDQAAKELSGAFASLNFPENPRHSASPADPVSRGPAQGPPHAESPPVREETAG